MVLSLLEMRQRRQRRATNIAIRRDAGLAALYRTEMVLFRPIWVNFESRFAAFLKHDGPNDFLIDSTRRAAYLVFVSGAWHNI
jgi:hypothetical protein